MVVERTSRSRSDRIYLHKGPFSGNAASFRLDSKFCRHVESKLNVETFDEKDSPLTDEICDI